MQACVRSVALRIMFHPILRNCLLPYFGLMSVLMEHIL